MPPDLSSYQILIRIRQCNLLKISDFMIYSTLRLYTNRACRKSSLYGSYVTGHISSIQNFHLILPLVVHNVSYRKYTWIHVEHECLSSSLLYLTTILFCICSSTQMILLVLLWLWSNEDLLSLGFHEFLVIGLLIQPLLLET